MSKIRKKRNEYNDLVVKELMKRYGFKRNYILMSVRGERTGTIPLRIKEDYRLLDSASRQAIQQKVDEL